MPDNAILRVQSPQVRYATGRQRPLLRRTEAPRRRRGMKEHYDRGAREGERDAARQAEVDSPGITSHRVAGEVTLPRPPHHRTYGSVYGGSAQARKPTMLVEQAQQAKITQYPRRDRLIHV